LHVHPNGGSVFLSVVIQVHHYWLRVTPPAQDNWQGADIGTWDDHRMAMCFSLAAFAPVPQPIRILNPECVSKTFPDYFDVYARLLDA